MKKLTQRKYWDSVHFKSVRKFRWFKLPEFILNYSAYVLWNNIYKKYLPKKEGIKLIEIGSAPGNELIKFKQRAGYEVFGVEYSKEGVRNNRKNFEFNKINPKNVIYFDFFSFKFQKKYKNKFDIVLSRGFIEHFSNPKDVVKKHLNLVKKGGLLIVTIPNLKGLNKIITKFFNSSLLDKHNLKIMDLSVFSNLFNIKDLEKKIVSYYGTFNFGLFNSNNNFLKVLLKILGLFQLILNFIFKLIFWKKGYDTKNTSPYLIFIGRKIR